MKSYAHRVPALVGVVAGKAIPAKATARECPHCLSEIPIAAGTCAYCGKDSPAAAAAV